MEIERAGLLVMSIVAAVVLSSIAWKLFNSEGIYGSRVEALSDINDYAEKCLSMEYGDCFVVDANLEEPIPAEEIRALSERIEIDQPIPEGSHRIKFTNNGDVVRIVVVE